MCITLRRLKSGGSSKAWMQRHVNDPYVKLAEKDNHRSRAAYKLIEVMDKHKIIRPNDFVIDLGAAPGGWSVVAANKLNFSNRGLLVSIDLLPMDPISTTVNIDESNDNKPILATTTVDCCNSNTNIDNVTVTKSAGGAYFFQGNFNAPTIRDRLRAVAINSEGVLRLADVVLSDMLMNTTGHSATDHLKSMNICHEVLEFTEEYLAPGGVVLCKFFQGGEDKELVEEARRQFRVVKLVKPKSSRQESREMYLLGVDKKKIIE